MASAVLREELNCSVCRSFYKDPVTLCCGHNFCTECINKTWQFQDKGDQSCPECRQRFKNRPELKRNQRLHIIAELMRLTEQEKTWIFCTYCFSSSVPATKSCLLCEASLCDAHLRLHSKGQEHFLVDPTTSMKNIKCSKHNKFLKYYCPEDKVCICVSCSVSGQHVGHQVELLKEAYEKKKEKQRNVLGKLTSMKENIEKRVHSLQELNRQVQVRVCCEKERINSLIKNIKEHLEALENDLLGEISRWETQVSLPVSRLIQQLEIKKDQLSRSICHIEELCNMTDPLTVLQGQESDRAAACDEEEEDYKEVEVHLEGGNNIEHNEEGGNRVIKVEERGNEDDKKFSTVADLDEGWISVTLYKRLGDIVTGVKVQRMSCAQETPEIFLDTNTAHNNVVVSSDAKTAFWSVINQRRPVTPQRFLKYHQVLSTISFCSGRHYWEVETSEVGTWRVGVAYPSIEREGSPSWIGNNTKSWCLYMYNKMYSVVHDSTQNKVPIESSCQRVGIYLDYEAGRLSFYQLCDPIRHLHTFTATFTEPLFAVFLVYNNGWVRIRI
ncbi:E3 ubiquitin/ISG15 ligase TRIM25-like [Rhinophrynus dorsalis]